MTTGSKDWTNAVTIIAVKPDGTLTPVKINAEGRLEAVILGELEGIVGDVTVLQDDPTRDIQGIDGATLRTVVVDGSGQLIMVPRGNTGNYVAVDADGNMSSIIQGLDGATLRTVAVDGAGNMVARIIGMDGVTARDVAVDGSGRLIMTPVSDTGIALSVDASGFLTCKLSGNLLGITGNVGVNQTAKDREIQGSEAGVGLHTVAVDNLGQIIMVPRGNTGNYMAVDANGYLGAILKAAAEVTIPGDVSVDQNSAIRTVQGVDGATLRTVVVDADGQIIMVPRGNTGNYMAVDANGYLGAILKAGINIEGAVSSPDMLVWSESYDSDETTIYSLAVYNGKLYAGSASGGKVFVFDGTDWSVSYDSDETNIFSLAVYNGKLYAGSGSGGKVFVFDGTDWSVSYDSDETDIRSLAVYNGKLYAGSASGGKVFVFDGTDWSESYDSTETYIFSLAVYNGKLYAGSGSVGKVFVFDGANWSESYDSTETHIFSLAVYNGKLYAGSASGGKVFVFDGTDWSVSYDSTETYILSLAVYNGKLYAGSGSGGKVFVFDGANWSESYDSDQTTIYSLAVYDGKLYAGSGAGGKVFVARGSSLADLAVDGQGFLSAIMKGNDSGTLRSILVDDEGRMEALMKGIYGATLKTIATDTNGNLISVIKDPTSANYMAIDANGYMAALMKGTYDATLKTIATDSDGKMLATIRNMPYEDVLLEEETGFITAGTDVRINLDAVPAGKIWVVTSIMTTIDDARANEIYIRIQRNGSLYSIYEYKATAEVVGYSLQGQWYLAAGDILLVDYIYGTDTSDVAMYVNGYVLPAYS